MSFAANFQNRFTLMVAVVVLLAALALGAWAAGKCTETDDYGNCVYAWNSASTDGILDGIGG